MVGFALLAFTLNTPA